ncbi:MAG: hypothetical protein ACP5JU_03805, partial [Minisyncoccia bacterium]
EVIFMNKDLKKGFIIPHTGSIQSKELFKKSLFNSDFKICGDYDFILRVLHVLKPYYIDVLQSYMKIGGVSNAYNYVQLHYNEYLKIVKMHKIQFHINNKLKFKLKLALSKFPFLFNLIQKLWWFVKT